MNPILIAAVGGILAWLFTGKDKKHVEDGNNRVDRDRGSEPSDVSKQHRRTRVNGKKLDDRIEKVFHKLKEKEKEDVPKSDPNRTTVSKVRGNQSADDSANQPSTDSEQSGETKPVSKEKKNVN